MDLRIAGLFALIAGCSAPGPDCDLDRECAAGDVCANTHDCVPAGTVHRVVVRWTIAAGCASDLEISVFDDDSSDFAHYAPVRCDLGVFTFDKLPVHFDRVRVLVLDGGRSAEAAIPPEGGDVVVEL